MFWKHHKRCLDFPEMFISRLLLHLQRLVTPHRGLWRNGFWKTLRFFNSERWHALMEAISCMDVISSGSRNMKEMHHLSGCVLCVTYHLPSNIESKYYQYVDKNRCFKKKRIKFNKCTFYGQLLCVLVIKQPQDTKDKLLALIKSIKVNETLVDGNITFYKEMGPQYIVDLNTIECVVGRIWDHTHWVIVDRALESHT